MKSKSLIAASAALWMAFCFLCSPAFSVTQSSFKGKVVVVVSPHGTDYLEGAGAIIATMIQDGATVYLVRVSNDEKHGYLLPVNQVRVQSYDEGNRAAAIMGFKQVIDLNLKDGEVTDVPEPELRERLAAIYRKLAPTTLVTADPWALYDPDLDDQRVARAAVDACWNASSRTFYPELPVIEGPTHFQNIYDRYFWTTNGGIHPENEYFNVTETLPKELQALETMQTAMSAEMSLAQARRSGETSLSNQPANTAAIHAYVEQRYGRAASKLGRRHAAEYAQAIYHYAGSAGTEQFIRTLAYEKKNPPPSIALPKLMRVEKGDGRVVLILAPDFPSLIQNAGGTAVQLHQAGFVVDAVILTNQGKDGNAGSTAAAVLANQTEDKNAAAILGIRRVLHLSFEQGQIADIPATVVREQMLWILRSENPETVILPDPWIRYINWEEVLLGRTAADAIFHMTNAATGLEQQEVTTTVRPVTKILYWENNAENSGNTAANAAVDVTSSESQKKQSLSALHAWLGLQALLPQKASLSRDTHFSGVPDDFTAEDKAEGKRVAVPYAEVFHQVEP